MKIKIKRKLKSDKISNEAVISYLLHDRGIDDVKIFLHPPHPFKIPFSDLFSVKDLEIVINILSEIKEKGRTIVVYTDYDADGITGGAIMWETLHLLGFKVMPYVPHRQHEGYGFSQKGIDAVKKLYDPALIISVDHGVAASDKIAYAKTLGISVVVTDHHLPAQTDFKSIRKVALAVFHTTKLSGAGVAYFFAKELFEKLKVSRGGSRFAGKSPEAKVQLENNFFEDYLALATIGTVADLVPLLDYSRAIVKYGLAVFPRVKRLGIKHILQEAGIVNRPITPYEIGFIIAPRINAVGRLTHALDALRLLCTRQNSRALELAGKIGDMNKQRQGLVEEALSEALAQVQSQKLVPSVAEGSKVKSPKLIILISDKWHEGIIGLIAAKITERFYRPTIVMTASDGVLKGSARSIAGFDITSFLRLHKKYLIDVGGHKAAAGFTIAKDKLDKFTDVAQKSAHQLLKAVDLIPMISVDMMMHQSSATAALAKSMEKLSPFGIGNPQPTFYSEAQLTHSSVFGKNRNHFKLQLKNGLEIIFFNKAEEYDKLSSKDNLGIVYNLEMNNFRGKEEVRGRGKFINVLT